MAFPTTSILDDFNRANTGPPPGTNWTSTIISGDVGNKVISNQFAGGSSAPASSYWNVGTFGADCEVYATITDATMERNGCLARITNPGGATMCGYYCIAQADHFRLFRIDNGSGTEIDDYFGITLANGDKFGMSIVGSLITVWYAPVATGVWGAAGTHTDATYGSAGYIGLRTIDNTNNACMDNFGGGTIGGAPFVGFNIALIKFP